MTIIHTNMNPQNGAILDKEKDVEGDIYANGDLNKNFKVYFREKLT